MVVRADAIGNRIEPLTAHVDGRTVGEVSAGVEVQPHECIARLQQGKENRLVHLAAGIGLDVGAIGAKKGFQAVNGDLLDNIHMLAATVIPFPRIPLGVFIRQLGPLRLHDGFADVVFRSDQFDMVLLTTILIFNRLPEFGINFCQGVFRRKHRLPHKPIKVLIVPSGKGKAPRVHTGKRTVSGASSRCPVSPQEAISQ